MGGGLAYMMFYWRSKSWNWPQFIRRLQGSKLSKMSRLIPMLLLLLAVSCFGDTQQDVDNEDYDPQPDHYNGRSFFFLGTLFRRWRDRWMAFHNPAPLYAGAAFPLNGYFNCPAYGCNPAGVGPQPGGFYPTYFSSPLPQQQQQQAQGNSNVYIYQTDQNAVSSTGSTPYGPGFFGPVRQPTALGPPPPQPLPLPPPAVLPGGPVPAQPPPLPQASAGSFGYGSGSVPVPLPICTANPLSCALG